jgi:hypothetical protein
LVINCFCRRKIYLAENKNTKTNTIKTKNEKQRRLKPTATRPENKTSQVETCGYKDKDKNKFEDSRLEDLTFVLLAES